MVIGAEMFEYARKLGQEKRTHPQDDVPLVVIASGRPNPAFGEAAEKFQQYWVNQSRALAGKSTRGKFIFAEGASHFLYVDAPGIVEESVRSIVQESRAR